MPCGLPGHQLVYLKLSGDPSQIQIEAPMTDTPTPDVMMLLLMFCDTSHSDTKSLSS